MTGSSGDPFSYLASEYDRSFSDTLIGSLMRRAVWREIDRVFQAPARVLELNCGTGIDALHLAERGIDVLATDTSSEMLRVAEERLRHSATGVRVELRQVPIERLGSVLSGEQFDGVLSNFGGFNCVADLERVARDLAQVTRPGGTALLCIMGPVVPWEWIWFLTRGRVKTAFRRLRPGGVAWRGIRVSYPSISAVRDAFGTGFAVRRVAAIGAILPPPYVGAVADQLPGLVRWLDRVERAVETWPLLPWLADHYLLTLERTSSGRSPAASTRAHDATLGASP